VDWKQFFASVIGSLAWPALVAFFLWLVRKHIGSLLARMIELHLPGGARAIFARELDRGRDTLEKLETVTLPRARTRDALPTGHREGNPQAQILAAYLPIEGRLIDTRKMLGLSTRMPFTAIIKFLIEKGYMEEGSLELFESLRRGRNAVVHALSREVTQAEATEYQTQAAALDLMLIEVEKKLTPPKRGD
jgi:hypothetical protein